MTSTVWLPTYFKISSFVFNRTKKKTYTGLEPLDGEYTMSELSL